MIIVGIVGRISVVAIELIVLGIIGNGWKVETEWKRSSEQVDS